MPSKMDNEIIDALEQALKKWHKKDAPAVLETSLPFLVQHTKAGLEKQGPVSPKVDNQLLDNLLEKLKEIDAEAAGLLRRFYIDDETGYTVAASLGVSEAEFYRRRRPALEALAKLAAALEKEAEANHIARLERRLEPSSYHQLFGLTDLRQRLIDLIGEKSDIKLFCLTGIGGIGKTSLADALARELIPTGAFEDIAWITAKQQQLAPWGEIQETGKPVLTAAEFVTALDQQLSDAATPPRPPDEILSNLKVRLGEQPHLIVLDNLETAVDYQELLPVLQDLSQLAWIVITSRVSIHRQPNVHITNLDQLSPADAEALVRDEARRRGIDDLAGAPAETMTRIYETAGGNPLALKLIVGQVIVRSLPAVLDDLTEARGQEVEALYDYIYKQAWELLDETARRVLLAMPLVARPGARLDHLAGITGMTQDDLYRSLDRLIRLSLVDVGGSLEERRYHIHRLTETFLHKQVTKWMP